MNNTKLVIAATAAALLTACGGSGGDSAGGGASSALFQYIKANTFSGFTNVGLSISGTGSNPNWGCGTAAAVDDQATFESKLSAVGGTVTTSNPTKWCATTASATGCLMQFDKFVVSDARTPQSIEISIDMPGLVADRMTEVRFNSQNPTASILTVSNDPLRTNSVNCPAMATQPANAIDGNWSGYKVTYNTSNYTGAATYLSLSCTYQTCTLRDAPNVTLDLRQQLNGTWSTVANAPKYAGATISDDLRLLSMFVCATPLIVAQTLSTCGFYTFKRL